MIRKPIENFQENIKDVGVLVAIHEALTGEKAGRRDAYIAVVNRSAIVLLVACWESFIEDLADKTFSALCFRIKDPRNLPKHVLRRVAQSLKEDKNELKIWDLADHGWKKVLKENKATATRSIGALNSPSANNIDKLFHEIIGLEILSKSWSWTNMKPENARKKLKRLIRLRGDIAHKVKSKKSTQKTMVEGYSKFIQQLAKHSNDRIDRYLKSIK